MLMKLNIQLFAGGSGSTTLSSGAGNKATLSVSFNETNANEPNVTNNTTNISASATMKMTSGSFSVSSTWYVRLYWHDNKSNKDVEVANAPVSALSRNQSVTASASFDVEHNADGTLSGYAIAKWDATGGNYTPYAGQVDTGWIVLTTIPRTTKIGNFTSYINNTVWIGWSPASTSFRHTLTYTFNGKTRTIGTGLSNGTYFTPPAELYAEMSGKSGKGTLTLTTYSGSNPIGSETSQITINAVENDVKPELDEQNVYDTNDATLALTTGSNVIVANKSLVQFNLSFHTRGYAKAKTLTVNGVSVTIPNGTVDEKDASITTYNVSVPLGTLSSNSISISLTDTRDYPATDTYTIEDFISYISLDIAPTFKRISPTTGEVGLSFSGNYFNDTFGKVANSLSIGYKYKENDATEYSDLITLEKDVDYKIVDNTYHSGDGDYKTVLKLEAVFDYKKLYNVQLFVNDAITTLPVINVTITKGIPIFWWNGEKVVVNGELYVADNNGENPKPAGGDALPIDSIFEYDGDEVPEGYEQVPDSDNKDMIKLGLSSAFEVSPTTYKHLPYDKILSRLNEHDSFTISSDGYVTIKNEDIKRVRVYASTRIDDWTTAGQYLSIFLNGVCEKRVFLNVTQSTHVETDILVKKGDVIDIRMYCSANKYISTDEQYTQFIVSVD